MHFRIRSESQIDFCNEQFYKYCNSDVDLLFKTKSEIFNTVWGRFADTPSNVIMFQDADLLNLQNWK